MSSLNTNWTNTSQARLKIGIFPMHENKVMGKPSRVTRFRVLGGTGKVSHVTGKLSQVTGFVLLGGAGKL